MASKFIKLFEPDSSGGSALPDGGTTGQVLTKQSATNGDADWETPSGGGTVFDIVDWTTLTLAPTSGDQTGSITGGVYKWVRQCTYRTGTYFRVVSVAEPLTKDGWYIDTTTSVIGTIVPNAQRI